MLERRPVWGLILGLNVCVVIWRISVQEPAMLEAEFEGGAGVGVAGYAETAGGGASVQQLLDASGYSHNKPARRRRVSGSHSFAGLAEQQQLYAGKHLLAERFDKSENMAKGTQSAIEATSNESKRVNSLKRKNKSSGSSDDISQQNKVNPTMSFANSTPTPLVTSATLRSVAESQPSTPTTVAAAIEQLELSPGDFGQLIDLYNFTYLMSQDRCAAHIEALILVHSAPGNVEKRLDIRNTWGAVGQLPKFAGITPIRVVFLLGAVSSRKLQSQLEHENAQFGDMVQGSFIDNYRNMTYKHVVALKWFLYNCAHAQFLMKVDDDVYVNTPQLLIYLYNARLNNKTASNTTTNSNNNNNTTTVTTAHTATAAAAATHTADDHKAADYSSKSNAHIPVSSTSAQFNASQVLFRHPQNLLFCELNVDAKVKRTYRSKWRVTRNEYASRYYPPYCSGYAIIYSPDVVLRLYKAAQHSRYFWIDDVHITGVLAQQLAINVTRSQAYILYEEKCRKLLDLRAKSSDVDFVYAWHLVKPEQMRALWILYSAKAMEHLTPSVYEEATSLLSPELEEATKYVAASEHTQKIRHHR